MKKLFVVLALTLTGCSTGIVSTNKDAYMVAYSQPVSVLFPLLSTDSWQKAQVYEEATAFCAEEQKGVETTELKLRESRFFQRFARAELNFRCTN